MTPALPITLASPGCDRVGCRPGSDGCASVCYSVFYSCSSSFISFRPALSAWVSWFILYIVHSLCTCWCYNQIAVSKPAFPCRLVLVWDGKYLFMVCGLQSWSAEGERVCQLAGPCDMFKTTTNFIHNFLNRKYSTVCIFVQYCKRIWATFGLCLFITIIPEDGTPCDDTHPCSLRLSVLPSLDDSSSADNPCQSRPRPCGLLARIWRVCFFT